MKLQVKAFALTCAVVWGVGLFLLTWWVIAFDGASTEPTIIAKFYRGYRLSPAGSLVGLVWGFADGLIGGAIFALVYNAFVRAPLPEDQPVKAFAQAGTTET